MDLNNCIKRAALQAVNAQRPVEVCIGEVVDSAPLAVSVAPKITLAESQLILTRELTDYTVEITRGDIREPCIVHNGLTVGERVLLLRAQGGQQFAVVGRLS